MAESDTGKEPSGEQATADAALPEPATDAVGQVTEALGQLASTVWALVGALPEWLGIALAAGVAALAGTMIGARLSRRQIERLRASVPPPPTAAEPTPGETPPQPENPAFRSYQRILEEKGIPAKEQDIQMRDFAGQFAEMCAKLANLTPGNAALGIVVDETKAALEAGEFGRAVELLNRVGDEEADAGRELRKAAETRLSAAATAKIVAGDLHVARMAYGDAANAYRQALDALPPAADALRSEYLNKHGTATYQAGDLDAAAASFDEALKLLEKRLGEQHPDVATALNNLALLHYSRGDYKAAEPLYKRALAIDEKVLGEDHPGVATDLNNLALLHKKQGNFQAAEPLLKRALAIKEKSFDPGHPSLVTGLKNYAALLRALDRGEEAAKLEAKAARLPPKRRPEKAAE